MSNDGQALLVGFAGRSKIRVARNNGLDFDEVHALGLQRIDGGDGTGGSGHGDGAWEAQFAVWEIGVEHGARNDHARPDDFSAGDLFSPLEQNGNISTHVAYTGNAVGDEERQDDLASAREPIAEG